MKHIKIMVQNVSQYKPSSNHTIEEVNQIIRDEIKKAFETVNIPAATKPPEPKEPTVLLDNFESTTALVEDAIRALKSNKINEAIAYLSSADENITASGGNQTSRLFIERAVRALKNNNTNEAINTLKLAYGM